jgi:hypothetical protein
MSKHIKIGLSTKGINRAIREINKYKTELQSKTEECRKRIAEALKQEIERNFNSAVVDDTIRGGTRQADVVVKVDDRGTMTVIVAEGEDAVFCEFGAGVYHNGSVGSSPHPYGNELGLTIGSYGKGKGKQQAWGYYDENHELVITRGTPASMPMYHAIQTITVISIEIAREVFK